MGKKRNSKVWIVVLVFLLGMVSSSQGQNVGKIYWTDVGNDKIQRANLEIPQGETASTRTDIEDLVATGYPIRIALDVMGRKMYWTIIHDSKIQRANLEIPQGETASTRTDIEDLITTGLTRPTGIALDVAAGKMYWTDTSTHKIQRANLDGSNVEDLVISSKIRGIALDVTAGMMYWTEYGIRRANLEIPQGETPSTRTDIEDLAPGFDANDIALDLGEGKMYWTDRAGGGKIKRANLDGTGIEDVLTALDSPTGIALDLTGGKMYWTSSYGGKIQRANLDGSKVEDLVTTGLPMPYGIAVHSCVDDAYEDNDGPSEATVVAAPSSIPDLVAAFEDQDWFKIPVCAGGELIVDVNFTHADGDIDIILFDELLTPPVAVGASTTDNETVNYSSPIYGFVYLLVANRDLTCNSYDLHVQLDDSNCQPVEIIYVDANAPGDVQDGSSWENAYLNLQDALAHANYSDDTKEIRVAGGTYYPDEGFGQTDNDRNSTFQLVNGVAIYGGYAGYGHREPNSRDIEYYETILSGDLLDNDTPGLDPCDLLNDPNRQDNSYHVVTGSGTDASAILDGFTIAGGNADGIGIDGAGGGMFNDGGSPTVANCTFSANAAYYGGGMLNDASSPTVANCTFSANAAYQEGGGMYNNAGSPTMTNCTFSANSATEGGGMHNWDSSPTLTNCTFSANSANYGGGMHNWYYSSLTLTNCTFSGNSAGWGGGGILNYWYSSAIVTNCILWDGGDEIFNDGNSTATVTYSDIQGGWIGGRGNIDADPCFVDADGFDNTPGTEDDNLRLSVGSPCIDAGDNNSVPAGITTDLDGKLRFYDDHATPDTGNPPGADAIVDMGAYEYIPHTIYVDACSPCRPDSDNGTSWEFAWKHLQDGLADAEWGDQICVAQNTYRPDTSKADPSGTGSRYASFTLLDGVAVYGGFPSGGGTWQQRDPDTRKTILSGDLAGNDSDVNIVEDVANDLNRSENSLHVVTATTADANSLLDGFIISGGNANIGVFEDTRASGGGINNRGGNPVIRNCVVRENKCVSNGGGMFNYGGGSTPQIINCTFTLNYSPSKGGGMYRRFGSPTLTDCVFSGNSARTGGGIWWYEGESSLTNCVFQSNDATYIGGGIFNSRATLNLTGCEFLSNSADYRGGGFYNEHGSSSPVFTDCEFFSNSAVSDGGAIYNTDGYATVRGCIFQDNSASVGGGIRNNYSGSATINDCDFVSNRATAGHGGGIHGRLTSVVRSRFYSNFATGSGGGIYCPIPAEYVNCQFSGNTAGDDGGGVFTASSGSPTTSTFVNCLFNGNQASSGGGGMWIQEARQTLTNCTFGKNYAGAGGGIFYYTGQVLTATGCIFWGNEDSDGLDQSAQIHIHYRGTPVDITYSCIMDGNPGDGSVPFGDPAITHNIDIDPLFTEPNGPDGIIGTEDDNLRLTAGSPCIDEGNNADLPLDTYDLDSNGDYNEPIPWDLDGHDRITNDDCTRYIVDMGAYELAYLYIGDFDFDCDVDFFDYAIFALAWLTEDGQRQYNPICDISIPADAFIDWRDLRVFADNWLAGK